MKRIWKSIGLAVLLAALLVGTGMAVNYGTTSVAGSVPASATLAAPGGVAGWTLNVGAAGNEHTSSTAATVSANKAWSLTVIDNTNNAANNGGHMHSTGDYLDNALTAGLRPESGSTTYNDIPASGGTALTITSGTTATPEAGVGVGVNYKQVVAWADPVDAYAISLLYTIEV